MKHFTKFMFLTFLSIMLGNLHVWGETYTYDFSSGGTNGTSTNTWTTDYFTIVQAKGTSNANVANYITAPRWYQNHTVTITPATNITITQIVINCSSNNNGQTISSSSGSVSASGNNSTWTGSTTSSSPLTLTMGKQCRPTSIVVTYTVASSYTISPASNDTNMGTVSLSGTTITATPKSGYRVSTTNPYTVTPTEAATVKDNEDNTFTVSNLTGNCTVQINFEAIPSHTLDIYINGTQVEGYPKQIAEGDHFDFPSAQETIVSGDDTYTFIGWVANTEVTPPTDTRPETVYTSTGAYMGIHDVTLYALYAIGTSSQTIISKTITSDSSGVPSSYGSANTFSDCNIEGLTFAVQQMYKNGSNLQWRAAGNSSGTGTMYNKTALPGLSKITLVYSSSDSNKNFTIKVGNSENPTDGTTITPTASGVNYSFDCSSANASYFVLTNGSGAGYLASITIEYKDGGTSYTDYCTTIPEETKLNHELSFAKESYTAVKGYAFTAPELTNPHYLTVTYTSEDTNVAEVNSTTGVVTIKEVGETVITATFEGDDTYKAGEASYTLNIVDVPTAPTFDTETGSTIAVGQKVRITSEGATSIWYSYNGNESTENGSSIQVSLSAKGEQTIRAKGCITIDGINYYSTETTATYNVVERPERPILSANTIFDTSYTVTISKAEKDTDDNTVTLWYSIDGGETFTQYTSPFNVTETTTVIAYAKRGTITSPTKHPTATYTKYTAATSSTGDDYYLVTDANTLADGDKIIIVNNTGNKYYALGKSYASTSNSNIVKVDVSNNYNNGAITPTSDVQILTLKKEDNEDNKWTLYYDYSNNKYLYTSGRSNDLKMHESGDDATYKSATINIEGDDYHANIVYLIENDKKREIQYNPQSINGIFACYLETQDPVQIYRNAQIDAITMYENRTGIDAANFYDNNTITENADKTVTVNLYRSLVADCWNAICLPFDLNDANRQKLFGEGYDLQTFSNVTTDETGTHLNFSKVSAETIMTAGTPYIVFPTQTVQAGAVVPLSNVTISETAGSVEKDGYAYHGFFAPTALLPDATAAGEENKSIIYIGTGNKFVYAKGTAKNPKSMLKGYRGYFTLPEGVEYAKISMEVNCDNDEITGISAIEGSDTNVGTRRAALNEGVYDLQGRRVADNLTRSTLKPGIYIMNGKKFIIK